MGGVVPILQIGACILLQLESYRQQQSNGSNELHVSWATGPTTECQVHVAPDVNIILWVLYILLTVVTTEKQCLRKNAIIYLDGNLFEFLILSISLKEKQS